MDAARAGAFLGPATRFRNISDIVGVMMLTSRAASAFLAGMLILGPHAAFGQDKYPAKVIRVVTATPGSNHDWGARIVAQELTPRVGHRVIVENRGSIAVELVAKDTPPDGYTVLFYGAYAWLQPLLQKVNWDPVEDLAPITLAISSPNVLVVHPSLPVKSVKELIALAKARPGDLNYSAGGGGSTPHVAAELFKYMANVRIVSRLTASTGSPNSASSGRAMDTISAQPSAMIFSATSGVLMRLVVQSGIATSLLSFFG